MANGGSTAASSNGTVDPNADQIVIRGYCEYTARAQAGVTRAQAQELLGKIKIALPDDLKEAVLRASTDGRKSHKSYIITKPTYAEDVAKHTDIILGNPDLHFNGRKLRAQVRPSRAVELRQAKLGRLASFLGTVDNFTDVNASWAEFSVIVDGDNGPSAFEDYVVAVVNPDSSITWSDSLQATTGHSVGSMQQKFAGYRQSP